MLNNIILNINKFSWAEMFNDSKGKTSPRLVSGFIGCITACLVFASSSMYAVFHTEENTVGVITSVTMQAVALFTVASSLFIVGRLTKDKEIQNGNISKENLEETK